MVLSDTFTHTSVIIFYIITLTVSPNNKGCGYLSSCATDYLPWTILDRWVSSFLHILRLYNAPCVKCISSHYKVQEMCLLWTDRWTGLFLKIPPRHPKKPTTTLFTMGGYYKHY